ncbi:hypothetical protein CRD60_06260 [Bifidobacterium aemilianum]|uniref:Uncharacterized protein n=2 Tax=Bifidobacterium aemilianum TaxID=2493120 RepID=A0A366K7D3_9BIFI|nr:hypothetical protein CRD60_06260 [Bifidobacterium aemilianum]
MSQEHIDHIRLLRHQAVGRRRNIAIALLGLTVLLLVLAPTLQFSPLFALIPTAALAAVLVLGAHASRQARQWEGKVAQARREHRIRPASGSAAQVDSSERMDAVSRAENLKSRDDDGVPTGVMEQREIRRALLETRKVQEQALARHKAQQSKRGEGTADKGYDQSLPSASKTAESANTATVRSDAKDAAGTQAQASQATSVVTAKSAAGDRATHDDATTELQEIHPAQAIDAFDIAARQDLISFSMGAPRNGVETKVEAPESLEIKSTKQVAKAQPVEKQEDAAKSQAQVETEVHESEGAAMEDSLYEAESFHEAEIEADVEAPEATSDSLSVGLDAILARRGA